ncbi:MAG: hypothetical protein GXO07_06780 [Crenarchaeota archaeon]|nr:hypothetical protein [Thermoproteota archaeon]
MLNVRLEGALSVMAFFEDPNDAIEFVRQFAGLAEDVRIEKGIAYVVKVVLRR